MSAKNLDNHNRWRNRQVAFRLSPEEADLLATLYTPSWWVSGILGNSGILVSFLSDIMVLTNCALRLFWMFTSPINGSSVYRKQG